MSGAYDLSVVVAAESLKDIALLLPTSYRPWMRYRVQPPILYSSAINRIILF